MNIVLNDSDKTLTFGDLEPGSLFVKAATGQAASASGVPEVFIKLGYGTLDEMHSVHGTAFSLTFCCAYKFDKKLSFVHKLVNVKLTAEVDRG